MHHTLETRIAQLLGIERPIIQGGMHCVGQAALAAAVANAGGLGLITALTFGTPDKLSAEIRKCRDLTDKPFGVNLTFLPAVVPPDYPGLIEDVLDEAAGVYPRVMYKGEMDAGAWSCGMVAGLIDDVPTVAVLMDRTMAQASEIIQARLAAMLAVPVLK